MKILDDKRIQDLRQLIGDAVASKVQFDEHFANSVVGEVLRNERKIVRFRNVLWVLNPADRVHPSGWHSRTKDR